MQGALATCAVTAVVVAPAEAAPTLASDRAYYLPGQPIALAGGGFSPGAPMGVVLAPSGGRGGNVLSLRDPVTADAVAVA